MIERHPSIDPVHPGEILREDILPVLSDSGGAGLIDDRSDST